MARDALTDTNIQTTIHVSKQIMVVEVAVEISTDLQLLTLTGIKGL